MSTHASSMFVSGHDLTREVATAVVLAAFSEALDLDHVDPDDNFFHLDGDSLSAIRLLATVKARLGREIGIGTFFENPTVAAVVDVAVARPHGAYAPQLRAAARGDLPPLSLAQEGLWFQSLLEGPTSASFNLPVILDFRGDGSEKLDVDALRAALTDLVERHESLRTIVPEVDGGPYQAVLDTVDALMFTVDESAQVDDLIARGFDVTLDPPLRATLVGPSGDRRLVLVLHHLSCDGSSLPILLADLDHAYGARFAGNAPQWAAAPVQYADYSAWHNARLLEHGAPTELATREQEFWVEELSGVPTESPLPTDHPRRADRTPRSATVDRQLSAELVERVAAASRACETTPFMVFQAAYAAALGQASGSDTVVVGVPVSTRSDPELDSAVGLYVSMLPLRTPVPVGGSARQVLEAVRSHDLAAFAHADIPFAHIVAAVNPPRSSGMHPLFQHALTVQSPTGALAPLSHLRATPSYGRLDVVKHDLTLGIVAVASAEGDSTVLDLEYAADLFEEATAERLLDSIQHHLATIVDEVLDGRLDRQEVGA